MSNKTQSLNSQWKNTRVNVNHRIWWSRNPSGRKLNQDKMPKSYKCTIWHWTGFVRNSLFELGDAQVHNDKRSFSKITNFGVYRNRCGMEFISLSRKLSWTESYGKFWHWKGKNCFTDLNWLAFNLFCLEGTLKTQ